MAQQQKQRRENHPGSVNKNDFCLPAMQFLSGTLTDEQLQDELGRLCGDPQRFKAALASAAPTAPGQTVRTCGGGTTTAASSTPAASSRKRQRKQPKRGGQQQDEGEGVSQVSMAAAALAQAFPLSVMQLAADSSGDSIDSDLDKALLVWRAAQTGEMRGMRKACSDAREQLGSTPVWVYEQLYAARAKASEQVLGAIRAACGGADSGGKTGEHPLYQSFKWLVGAASGDTGGGWKDELGL